MNKKVLISFILVIGLVSLIFSQAKVTKYFVKDAVVDILDAQDGNKMGTLNKGVEATVLEDRGNLVKVQITTWVPRTALTEKRLLRAMHIVVKTRSEAEAVFAELKSGKAFSELAKQKSTGPTASRGGDLGYFIEGDFDAAIESAIASLQINEVSGIIQTEFGFNIFKRTR